MTINEFVEKLVKEKFIKQDKAAEIREDLIEAVSIYHAGKTWRSKEPDPSIPEPEKLRAIIEAGKKLIEAMHELPEAMHELPEWYHDLPYTPDSSDVFKIKRIMQRAVVFLPTELPPRKGKPPHYHHYFFINHLFDIYFKVSGKKPTFGDDTYDTGYRSDAHRFVECAYKLVDTRPPSIGTLKNIKKNWLKRTTSNTSQ